jgi:hypothetical protein
MKEKRNVKITFNRNGRGAITPKLSLPVPFVKELGFTEDDREAYIELAEDKIIITKKRAE